METETKTAERPADDMTGRRFGRWTVLEGFIMTPDGERKLRCRCDCGTERYVCARSLKRGTSKSCGCLKRELDRQMNGLLTHAAGTSLDIIRSRKLPSDNTTGYKGVYLVRGKYLAKIVFQKKQYVLGKYDNIEDAAAARREAEDSLFGEAAAFILRWKERAGEDPEWAGENPAEIHVMRDVSGRLAVACSPRI